MTEQQTHVIWDCRSNKQKPSDLWKLILNISGSKPTSLLVLQPNGTEIPQALCTVMRLTYSKIFVGNDSLQFCFLELCLLLNSNPNSKFIII